MARKGYKMEIKFIELKQRHVEAFDKERPEFDINRPTIYFGGVVRAAVKAGWLELPKIENVEEMKPGEARKLAEAILQEYSRVEEIDPS